MHTKKRKILNGEEEVEIQSLALLFSTPGCKGMRRSLREGKNIVFEWGVYVCARVRERGEVGNWCDKESRGREDGLHFYISISQDCGKYRDQSDLYVRFVPVKGSGAVYSGIILLSFLGCEA